MWDLQGTIGKDAYLPTLSPGTKQGQLISESGTMSGGGGRPSRGRMALGSAAPRGNADAEAVQKELKQAEKLLEALTQVSCFLLMHCLYQSLNLTHSSSCL
jgi:hypothetical protein